MIRKSIIHLIEWYQKVNKNGDIIRLECNFVPSCSEYMKLSLQRHGLFRGSLLGIKRIIRCNDKNLCSKKYDPAPTSIRKLGWP